MNDGLSTTQLADVLRTFIKLSDKDQQLKEMLENLTKSEIENGYMDLDLLQQVFDYLEVHFQKKVDEFKIETEKAS